MVFSTYKKVGCLVNAMTILYILYTFYTLDTLYTVYTMFYHNTCIKSTKIQAFCTLRTPFDIVFNALFNRGSHPIQPLQNVRFYKYGHNSEHKWVPRHDSDGFRREIS